MKQLPSDRFSFSYCVFFVFSVLFVLVLGAVTLEGVGLFNGLRPNRQKPLEKPKKPKKPKKPISGKNLDPP